MRRINRNGVVNNPFKSNIVTLRGYNRKFSFSDLLIPINFATQQRVYYNARNHTAVYRFYHEQIGDRRIYILELRIFLALNEAIELYRIRSLKRSETLLCRLARRSPYCPHHFPTHRHAIFHRVLHCEILALLKLYLQIGTKEKRKRRGQIYRRERNTYLRNYLSFCR